MQQTCALVILAGGEGRRLGRVDKALLQVAGKPMLSHILARLAGGADQVLLSANGDPARFAAFGLPVVGDEIADAGPLAGIAAASAYCWREWPDISHMVTVPVDAPCLPRDLLQRLATVRPDLAAIARCPERVHWPIARWPLAALSDLASLVAAQGMRRVEDLAERVGYQTVEFPDPDSFLNVNRTQDLETLVRKLTSP